MTDKNEPIIFALDIGTRSVVGVIVQKQGDQHHVLDYSISEHKERSMLDGQIHDILAVAQVIQKVKEELESKHGPLKKVAVAAAGRSLKTEKAIAVQPISGRPLLTKEDVLAFELQAVQDAQKQLAEDTINSGSNNDFCVGYSVTRYLLDENEIGSLIDQRGSVATVEVIATFLPRIVVDSLLAALRRAGLEMEALTLEPIAAINVLVPASMRRLNVALVDIGAGTSDIAITADGTITAYGMVPYAGDEITEAISQEYVLDFNIAEKLKKELNDHEFVQFEDILGMDQRIASVDIIEKAKKSIQSLAELICKEIIRLNRKTPQAVLLIGGGSLTPLLNSWIAELLGLPQNRVGIRGLDNNQHIDIRNHSDLQGPSTVTPIGIAIVAGQHPIKYISAKVNDRMIHLFDLTRLTVRDAILASGIDIKKWHGRPGLAMTIKVHNQTRHIPGTFGQRAQIKRNGQMASIDEFLEENDLIEVLKGENGHDAQARIEDIWQQISIEQQMNMKQGTTEIMFNGQPVQIKVSTCHAYLNQSKATFDDQVNEGDHIEFKQEITGNLQFHDVFRYVDIPLDDLPKGEKMVLLVNGEPATFNTPIAANDQLELIFESLPSATDTY